MAFAGYNDFNDCVAQNQDKHDPRAFCGWLKHRVEVNSPDQDQLNDLFHILTWRSPLRKPATRRVVRSLAGILAAIDEPHARAIGATLNALVSLFERKNKEGENK